jgi:hypothetical protein
MDSYKIKKPRRIAVKDFSRVGKIAGLLLGALICLVTPTMDPAFAQSGGSRPTAIERRIEHTNRETAEYERDRLNRELKEGGDKQSDRKRDQGAVVQVKQDFENLQARYNQIELAIASKQDLHQDSIMSAVAAINRSASRLKVNLALPRPKNDEERESKSAVALEQTDEPLLMLTKRIYSFVTNPLFEASAALNVKHVGNARRDLDGIIELSDRIVKAGNKSKSPTKP